MRIAGKNMRIHVIDDLLVEIIAIPLTYTATWQAIFLDFTRVFVHSSRPMNRIRLKCDRYTVEFDVLYLLTIRRFRL